MSRVWYSLVEYIVFNKKTDKRVWRDTYELVTSANPTKDELIRELESRLSVGANNFIRSAEVIDHITLGQTPDDERMYSGFAVNIFGR